MPLDAQDILSNEGLAKIEELVAQIPQDFEISNAQGYKRSVQATFRWKTDGNVYERASSIFALAEGAMWIDALCKNLRDARERLGEI